MAQKLSQKLALRVENEDVVRTIRLTLKNNWILLRKTSVLPTFPELLTLWECFLFWENILHEVGRKGGPLGKNLCSRWRITWGDFEKAIHAVFLRTTKKDVCPHKILKGDISLPSRDGFGVLASSFLLSENSKFFRAKKEWVALIQEDAFFYASLSPLPPLKNDRDRAGALKILGASEGMSLDQIKKIYKKLALLKHPDKLSVRGIPREFVPLATDNFKLIQRAYDILKKEACKP